MEKIENGNLIISKGKNIVILDLSYNRENIEFITKTMGLLVMGFVLPLQYCFQEYHQLVPILVTYRFQI